MAGIIARLASLAWRYGLAAIRQMQAWVVRQWVIVQNWLASNPIDFVIQRIIGMFT